MRRRQQIIVALLLLVRWEKFQRSDAYAVIHPISWLRHSSPKRLSHHRILYPPAPRLLVRLVQGESRRTFQSSHQSTTSADESTRLNHKSWSNFWYSITPKENDDIATRSSTSNHVVSNKGEELEGTAKNSAAGFILLPAPCVPTLDQDGPFPPAAYLTLGDICYEPKRTCRILVAVDVNGQKKTRVTPMEYVNRMHDFVDAGFNTFQLSGHGSQQVWAEENIYSLFERETPGSVRNTCQLILPFQLPGSNEFGITTSWTRRQIHELIARIGAETIDNLQIRYSSTSPWVYDILDHLEDLKREGLIRSVSFSQIPPSVRRKANDYGFSIDSCQLNVNLLDPTRYDHEQQQISTDLRSPLMLTGPLAGGLLTNKHLRRRSFPLPWEFTPAERGHWSTSASVWADQHQYSKDNQWAMYQSKLLSTLEAISQKHQTTIASVVLRWSLQLDQVASAVVSCRMVNVDDGLQRKRREQELRSVFRFELDHDDMETLWELSGRRKPQVDQSGWVTNEVVDTEREENMAYSLVAPKQKGSSERPNRQLWL